MQRFWAGGQSNVKSGYSTVNIPVRHCRRCTDRTLLPQLPLLRAWRSDDSKNRTTRLLLVLALDSIKTIEVCCRQLYTAIRTVKYDAVFRDIDWDIGCELTCAGNYCRRQNQRVQEHEKQLTDTRVETVVQSPYRESLDKQGKASTPMLRMGCLPQCLPEVSVRVSGHAGYDNDSNNEGSDFFHNATTYVSSIPT